MCPHCGLPPTGSSVIVRDGFEITEQGGVAYRHRTFLTPLQMAVFSTLARRHVAVTAEALLNAAGSDAYPELIKKVVSDIRLKLAAAGMVSPIQSVSSRGYFWKGSNEHA